jgi:hypothetical protein
MTREESRRARGLSESDEGQPASEGTERNAFLPPTQPHSDVPNQPPDQQARRESVDLTTYLREAAAHSDQADDPASRYDDLRPEDVPREGDSYSPDAPPRQPRRREFDRERRPQPVHHVTGDDAIQAANAANREIGTLPEQRALTSPHKRYPRP